MISFTKTDAWILWSVDIDDAGSTLAQLIARADFVNHAIPNREEIERALSKGLEAGLLTSDGHLVRFSADHVEKVQSVVSKARAAYDSWSDLHSFLAERKWPAICRASVTIAEEAMKAAYSDYLGVLKSRKTPIQPPQPTLTIRPFSIRMTPLQPPSAAPGERG